MSLKGKTLVRGHALVMEGKPFTVDGVIRGRVGFAKCSCGAASAAFDTDADRKRWHNDHKAAVQVFGGDQK